MLSNGVRGLLPGYAINQYLFIGVFFVNLLDCIQKHIQVLYLVEPKFIDVVGTGGVTNFVLVVVLILPFYPDICSAAVFADELLLEDKVSRLYLMN